MYILYENGEKYFNKNFNTKNAPKYGSACLCLSAKMGHCGCMKRSRVVSRTSTFLYTGYDSKLGG